MSGAMTPLCLTPLEQRGQVGVAGEEIRPEQERVAEETILPDVAHHHDEQVPEPFPRVVPSAGCGHPFRQVPQLVPHDGGDQLVAGREAPVHRGAADAGPAGDFRKSDRETGARTHLESGREDLLGIAHGVGSPAASGTTLRRRRRIRR
jgi:hypothetical protein